MGTQLNEIRESPHPLPTFLHRTPKTHGTLEARASATLNPFRALQPRLSISRSRFILLELLVQESATSAVEIAGKHFPGVECKWGDQGLEEIIADSSILGVVVVLAGQAQVDFSLKLLKAGKNVLQATSELETAVSSYKTNLGYSRKLSI